MKFKTKLVLINVVILVATISVVTGTCLYEFRSALLGQAGQSQDTRLKTFWELLSVKGREFLVADGKLVVGETVLNGDFSLPDRLKELCGGTATIFMGDTRISTNVLKDDGSRAVGTKLTGPAYDAVIGKGQPYRGEADILGTQYFTAYDPIKNAAGQTIGVLYVGVKKDEFFAQYDRLKLLVIGLSLVILLLAAYVNRVSIYRACRPIAMIHDVLVKARTEGDLSQRLDCKTNDEIGVMCSAFNGFLDTLNGILREISQSAAQLTD